MNKVKTLITVVTLIVLLPLLTLEARGGRGGGAAMRGHPEAMGHRGIDRSLQRTPAMSRAALYSGAAALGASAGAAGSYNNGEEPIIIENPSNQ